MNDKKKKSKRDPLQTKRRVSRTTPECPPVPAGPPSSAVDREMETIKRQVSTIQGQQALLDYLQERQPRTIIEISSTHRCHQLSQCNSILYALCNDGSVWEMRSGSTVWGQLPPIPQD